MTWRHVVWLRVVRTEIQCRSCLAADRNLRSAAGCPRCIERSSVRGTLWGYDIIASTTRKINHLLAKQMVGPPSLHFHRKVADWQSQSVWLHCIAHTHNQDDIMAQRRLSHRKHVSRRLNSIHALIPALLFQFRDLRYGRAGMEAPTHHFGAF